MPRQRQAAEQLQAASHARRRARMLDKCVDNTRESCCRRHSAAERGKATLQQPARVYRGIANCTWDSLSPLRRERSAGKRRGGCSVGRRRWQSGAGQLPADTDMRRGRRFWEIGV